MEVDYRREGSSLKVALHACCGPCALEPLDALAVEHEVVLVFANPNIQPAEEYLLRRDTLLEWAQRTGVPVVEVEDPPDTWERAVEGVRDDRDERCRRCYTLRLERAATHAVRLGCDALATTLAVSPYQDFDAIEEIGSAVAGRSGLTWVSADYRERYSTATKKSRELGMYRQNYCGCLPSKAEAQAERAARRARRAQR